MKSEEGEGTGVTRRLPLLHAQIRAISPSGTEQLRELKTVPESVYGQAELVISGP